jgi:hypothetical protein
MAEDTKLRYPIEAYKMAFDYVKHISTLCTGSILLIAGLLEKLFSNPEWKICVAISLIAFLLAIVSSIVAQAGIIEMIDKEETIGKWAWPTAGFGIVGMYLFFLTGLTSFLLFALKNLF